MRPMAVPGPGLFAGDVFKRVQRPLLLVVGDFMIDRYVWGDVSRISPEAPIQVLRVLREESRLGGAANVVKNVVALSARAVPCGVVGRDAAGRQVRGMLARISETTEGVMEDPSRPTIEKTRMIAHAQQVLRVDREKPEPLPPPLEARLVRFVRRWAPRVDGVLLSDYGKGLLTPAVLRAAIDAARRAGTFVLVDPKGRDYARYRGATALTPNRAEAQEGTGLPLAGRADIARAARLLKRRLDLKAVFVTLGAEGIGLLDGRGRLEILPARAKAVYDVTGAGDTVLATLGVALALGADWRTGAILANHAAGIVVGKVGSATATREEVLSVLGEADHHPKVLPLAKLLPALAEERRRGRKIVFTNGCFDLLHVGHVRLLEQARSAGDVLVLGLNSDASVRANKGDARPVVGQQDRAAVLAALSCVDYVTFFDDPTPARLIRRLRPDVLVKGDDWRGKGVVGRSFVESYGGRVEFVRLVPGHSTTGLIARIREGVAS